MASIYEYLSYRKWIKDQASEWKKRGASHTLAKLAELAQVQAPYLTNVLKERVHLNADQFFSVAQAFALTSEELQYGQTLLEWERSSHEKRKMVLKQKLEEIKAKKLKTENHLKSEILKASTDELTQFYLNPELQLVHAFFGIEKYAKNLSLIASSLHLDLDFVEKLVKQLLDLGFLKSTPSGLQKTKKSIHLDKGSPVCRPQQLLMQQRSLQHLQLTPDSEKYNFSVIFTADPDTREKIHREFLNFLSQVQKWVDPAPSQEVYQLHFDLFAWSRSGSASNLKMR